MLYLITGEKGSGLLGQSAELITTLGHNRLMVVSTIKGIDDHLKEVFESRNLTPEIYQVSEEYFEMRLKSLCQKMILVKIQSKDVALTKHLFFDQ